MENQSASKFSMEFTEFRKFSRGRLMVRQLHPPPRTRGEHNQDLTIIFFCGSTNEPSGWKNTWIQRGDPEVCWPRDWLPKAVEKWGLRRGMLVLSVSYLGGPGSFCDKMENIVSHLVEILPNSARWHLTHPQMIALVGCGIGGLVIKYFLAEVDKVARGQTSIPENCKAFPENCKAFQENLQGIVFYAVPHSGSSEDFAKYTKICKNVQTSRSFLNLSLGSGISFHEFNQQMEQLNCDFRCSIKEDTMIVAIVEGRPMGQEVLVPDASAQRLAGKKIYTIEDANHLEVCQPVDEQHPSYVKLLSGLEAMMASRMMTLANVGIATPAIPSVSVTSDCVPFPYQVLRDATKNFDPSSQIGTGASGTVFKARIAHNGSECEVAIKRLSYDGFSSELNEAFRQEIWRVSTVRHKNIVSVLGYSVLDNSPLLMVTPLHSSLFKCLYEGENPQLNWHARLKIAVGVAEGLAYLHDGAPELLVHCDIKPGNILFDADTLQAYIADFGTAKFMQPSESMVETMTVRGTRGFMDPHFLQYRRRSTKMDVYSFGVLLLVLISGEEDAVKLVDKAKKNFFVDIQFNHQHDGTYKAWEFSRVLEIARQCMRYEPSDRPSMSQVVMMLRGDIPCSIRPSLSSFVVSSIDFVQIASTSTFHKLRHSSMLSAAVLIAAILMIVVIWKTSV